MVIYYQVIDWFLFLKDVYLVQDKKGLYLKIRTCNIRKSKIVKYTNAETCKIKRTSRTNL